MIEALLESQLSLSLSFSLSLSLLFFSYLFSLSSLFCFSQQLGGDPGPVKFGM